MADTKISALPSATTPLAGTEVLPIVQSSTTKKVSVSGLFTTPTITDSLTVTGSYPFASLTATSTYSYVRQENSGGSTKSATWVVTNAGMSQFRSEFHRFSNYDSSINYADIDSNGNYIPAVAGKGINFTANTPASGMASQLLNWYEEGTWTPVTSVAGGTYTAQTGRYVRIGKHVTCIAFLEWSAHSGAGGNLAIDGLPFTASSAVTYTPGIINGTLPSVSGHSIQSYIVPGTSTVTVLDFTNATGAVAYYAIPSSGQMRINYTYFVD